MMEMKSSWSTKEKGEQLMNSQLQEATQYEVLILEKKLCDKEVWDIHFPNGQVYLSKRILYYSTVIRIQGSFFRMEPHPTVFVFSSPCAESSLESQADMESAGQQSDDASLPSTSHDPGNSFLLLTIILTLTALFCIMSPNQRFMCIYTYTHIKPKKSNKFSHWKSWSEQMFNVLSK